MKSNRHSKLGIIYQYYAHIVPAIACAYNFIATDFLFHRGYTGVLLVFAIIFFIVNFATTKLTGNFSYWFLTWEDPYASALVVCFFLAVIKIMVNFLVFVSEIAKARRLPNLDSLQRAKRE